MLYYEAISPDLVSLGLRGALGSFFAISGYHKLFSPSRKATLEATFKSDGVYSPAMMKVIPTGELLGGLGLLAGALTSLAAAGLVMICLGATILDGRKRVKDWKPLDAADRLDDYLYLPEVLYIVMLFALIWVGPGIFSLDYLIAQM